MKTQSGRSMIEMLGVLAIIGVLSIGGLAGYTKAMNSYQANQIMDYMNRCSVAVQERLGVGATVNASTNCTDSSLLGSSDTGPVTISTGTVSASQFTLTGTAPDSTICTTIGNRNSTNAEPQWSCSGTTVTATYKL